MVQALTICIMNCSGGLHSIYERAVYTISGLLVFAAELNQSNERSRGQPVANHLYPRLFNACCMSQGPVPAAVGYALCAAAVSVDTGKSSATPIIHPLSRLTASLSIAYLCRAVSPHCLPLNCLSSSRCLITGRGQALFAITVCTALSFTLSVSPLVRVGTVRHTALNRTLNHPGHQ